jgi:hypothetical protein
MFNSGPAVSLDGRHYIMLFADDWPLFHCFFNIFFKNPRVVGVEQSGCNMLLSFPSRDVRVLNKCCILAICCDGETCRGMCPRFPSITLLVC